MTIAIKTFITAAAILVLGLVGFGGLASAQSIQGQLCEGATDLKYTGGNGADCLNAAQGTGDGSPTSKVNYWVALIVNIFSWIVGVLAVLFIIYGGAKYITSGGDSNKVSSAKSTIIYALIGLIIVAISQLLVRFVLGVFTGSPSDST